MSEPQPDDPRDDQGVDVPDRHVQPTSASATIDAERTRTLRRLRELRGDFTALVAAAADSNLDDEHDPEGSTIAFERSQLAALVSQAEVHLEELDLARERLAAGDYGRCESCGRQIAPERLQVRPVARRCVRCAGRRRR